MADEVLVVPSALRSASEFAVDESASLLDQLHKARGDLSLPGSAIGRADRAAAVAAAHDELVAAGAAAVERIAVVLEYHAEGLKRVASEYEQTDRAAAESYSTIPGLDL